MKLKFLLITVLGLVSYSLFAQNSDYKSNAENLRNTIWLNPKNGFELKTIPESLKNESAVILSRSYESEASSKKKFKYLLVTATVTTQYNQMATYHERTMINDKAALENYSNLSYQKKLNNTVKLGIANFYSESNTYVGIKIIKPSGEEIVLNTSEEVLVENSKSEKRGKIAVSGLQIGDIIDFYISYVEKTEDFKDFNELVILNNEYHTLNYSYDFNYSDRFAVSYFTGNGCPAFVQSKDGEGNLNLHLEGKNLSKATSSWWNSTYRNYPYFQITAYRGSVKVKDGDIKRNEIYNPTKIANDASDLISKGPMNKSSQSMYVLRAKQSYGAAKSFFGKKFKTTPKDSLVRAMYDFWKFDVFCYYTGYLDNYNNLSTRRVNDVRNAYAFSNILEKNKIKHEIIIVSSRYWKRMEESTGLDDVNFIIKINEEKPSYVFFNKVLNSYDELPGFIQGENAFSLYQYKNDKKYKSTIKPVTLPVNDKSLNVVDDELEVNVLADMKKIKIVRTVSESGVMKSDDQLVLLDMATIHKSIQLAIKSKKDVEEMSKGTAKVNRDKYRDSFEKDIKQRDEYFTKLIEDKYEMKPEQLADRKVVNTGLTTREPKLVFSSSFVLNDFIQKAGNNYLLNAGKLIGTVDALKEADLKRDVDIYMPSSRELNYKIVINVPEGYQLKGAENLDKSVANECGSFTSQAKLDRNILTIEVKRAYLNNFEKARDWPKLVSLLDAAHNFTSKKVLLEKL